MYAHHAHLVKALERRDNIEVGIKGGEQCLLHRRRVGRLWQAAAEPPALLVGDELDGVAVQEATRLRPYGRSGAIAATP